MTTIWDYLDSNPAAIAWLAVFGAILITACLAGLWQGLADRRADPHAYDDDLAEYRWRAER